MHLLTVRVSGNVLPFTLQPEVILTDHADQDEDNTWYLALPGIVGASMVLLVVSITGALNS